MYKLILTDDRGNVIDTFEGIDKGDSQSRLFGMEILKWIQRAMNMPTLALGTEMRSIPLCPCCHQSEGSCSCPAGRDATCRECGSKGDNPNGTELTSCNTCGGSMT